MLVVEVEVEVGVVGVELEVLHVRLELEIVSCLMKVRGRLILVLMRFHQFCPNNLIGNRRRVKRNRQGDWKRRVC